MHSVSVIVSNFNGAKYLQRLLKTLQAQKGVELEIIVVDRNSTDESHRILANFPEVKVLSHPPESGLVSGYAAGVPLATHDLFFFCNEDMWFAPDCLRLCCDLLATNDRMASVMPVQWTYDGAAIVNCGIWFEKCIWKRSCPTLDRRSRWHLVSKPARVSYANAGACLIRRSAYEAVGGWDTSFFLDDEDTDISLRFWQHDLQCWVQPDAIVGHAVGASNSKELKTANLIVSQKRYVGALSNFLVLALKTFSPGHLIKPFLAWGDRFARNLAKARFKSLLYDIKALILTAQRLPDIAEFRSSNKLLNQRRPGQQFFSETLFQYSAISDNVAARTNAIAEAALTMGL